MTDLPMACSLDGPAQAERAAAFAALADRALIRSERTSRGWRLLYREAAGVEHSLRRLIAAESECCPFLGFALDRSGQHLSLTVQGPAEAQAMIELLFDPRAGH